MRRAFAGIRAWLAEHDAVGDPDEDDAAKGLERRPPSEFTRIPSDNISICTTTSVHQKRLWHNTIRGNPWIRIWTTQRLHTKNVSVCGTTLYEDEKIIART